MKRLKKIFFNDEYYHNLTLRLKLTRFFYRQIHLIIVIGLVIYSKLFRRKQDIQLLDMGMVHKVLNSFWKYSLASVMHKIEEGYYFRGVHINSPSLEIGSGDFITSTCFFYGKRLDIASDIHFGAKTINKISVFRIFDHFARFDAHHLPFKNNSLQDIVMVHIVDHLEDIGTVLKEISRVLKKGGRFYFSGYSKYWLSILNTQAKNKIPVYNSYQYNLMDEKEWDELLKSYGMRVVNHGYYLSGKMARFYYIARFLYHARRNGIKCLEKIPFLNRWYEEMLLNFFIPRCEKDIKKCKERNSGIHIWIQAEKKNPDA